MGFKKYNDRYKVINIVSNSKIYKGFNGTATSFGSHYEIVREKWWRFWKIDNLIISIETRYDREEVYNDYWGQHTLVYRISKHGRYSDLSGIKPSVIDAIRYRLRLVIDNREDISKLIKKSKKLTLKFRVNMIPIDYHSLEFYIVDDEVYFEGEKSYERELKLKKIGIL